MTTLLIDLGNTALKWTTLEEPDSPHTIVHRGSTHFKEELYELWLQMHPTRIIGCTVAAPVVAFSLTKFFNDHGINWVCVRSEPSFDGDFKVRNCYARPSQLGADRWYAAIGAADALRSEALLVVHTGTATTVDSIEVVRCLDCKHWLKFESSLIGEVMCCTGQGSVNIQKQPDDFCSYGERKDGYGNG